MPDPSVKLHGTRPGKVGREIRAAIRDLGELDGLQRIDAAIAERTADVVDGAYRANDARLVLAGLRDLRTVVARLTPTSDPRSSGDDDPDAGGDDRPDPLAGALGYGPSLGNSTDA
ncbi:hypothetical protein [uncultured Aeromicrobium sp.]|uniref:hypothetical protein n=1 Tax=uncultured Aeromicrobium sp. TaxID=337820 RepID=UPI0025DD3EE2|nr:hypothetical protein [uncultured Aeromicrobium sp.]